MENQHPSTEQLAGYLDAPEAANQSEVRHHLMACQKCRVRIDQITQLELDIKHYAPRFAGTAPISENPDHTMEQFIDNRVMPHTDEQQDIEDRIKSDPGSLKAALHYAVHSSAMNRDLAPASLDETTQQANTCSNAVILHGLKSWLAQITSRLREPVPLWTAAPAAMVLAVAVGMGVFYSHSTINSNNRVVAFQDDATITFQQPGAPAGSIGFFHDAQAQRKPFEGIKIMTANSGELVFSWPPITNATEYKLKILSVGNNETQLISETTSTIPSVTLTDIALSSKRHYQWQLSGTTRDNMIFKTSGDFLYLQNP